MRSAEAAQICVLPLDPGSVPTHPDHVALVRQVEGHQGQAVVSQEWVAKCGNEERIVPIKEWLITLPTREDTPPLVRHVSPLHRHRSPTPPHLPSPVRHAGDQSELIWVSDDSEDGHYQVRSSSPALPIAGPSRHRAPSSSPVISLRKLKNRVSITGGNTRRRIMSDASDKAASDDDAEDDSEVSDDEPGPSNRRRGTARRGGGRIVPTGRTTRSGNTPSKETATKAGTTNAMRIPVMPYDEEEFEYLCSHLSAWDGKGSVFDYMKLLPRVSTFCLNYCDSTIPVPANDEKDAESKTQNWLSFYKKYRPLLVERVPKLPVMRRKRKT